MRGFGGLAVALLATLAGTVTVGGCGRSSLIGNDDCPAGAHCIPDMARPDGGRDMSLDMRPSDMLDMRGDMRGDMRDMRPGDMRTDMACIPRGPENCTNKIDDNCNGFIDCMDNACSMTPACVDKKKEKCDNGVDDDGNGLTDCADPACFGDPICIKPGVEICNNAIDDDDDGLIDCADPDCLGNPACKPHMGNEICDNGVDDNGDGLVDCTDPQCVAFPACLHADCQPTIFFGTIDPHDSSVTRGFDTRTSQVGFDTCAPAGGAGVVGEFTVSGSADVRLDFAQGAGEAHVVSVFRAGVGQACDQNSLFCLKAGQSPTATHTFSALPAGTYRVIVESYPGTAGASTVTLSTSPLTTPEVCDNGVDDDGDGLIDCADSDCAAAANCVAQQCKPELNLGALVVNAPPKTADFNTNNGENRYHPTCAGSSAGKDIVVRFTLHETAGVLVNWTQGGGSDHVITIFHTPPPGTACDASQMSCYYPGGASGGTVAFSPRPAGDYIFIFKAINAGAEGPMHISVSAFKNRQMEICNNGIDDDGNGLTDCDDPACYGVGGCKPPICTPDVDLGDFTWGTQRSATLDVTMGVPYYTARCAKGGGKSQVVRVRLLQPMGLGYSCSETGSQVLQLTQLINPLDACDANPVNCADPSVLPFGCNFVMPNLQPGVYDVLVQAFSSGQEGTVNLTLFGVEEKSLEICNNGVDDDMDGRTDCLDLKCVTSPLCQKFACRADHNMGTIPLNGTTASTTVQTSGAGDDQVLQCATASGGQDAVIDFTVPSKSNLKIEWAQVGNHDFALYQNINDQAACDAGPQIVCTSSMAQSTGAINLSALAAGKYHLVVDADQPGTEGGVVLQLSGTPSP
jgi:hypothetical protein